MVGVNNETCSVVQCNVYCNTILILICSMYCIICFAYYKLIFSMQVVNTFVVLSCYILL